MSDTQVIFRVDEKLLKKLDSSLKASGFRTRNEWFRNAARNFLEEVERKKALKLVEGLTVKGVTEEDVALMVREWREKYKAQKD